MSFHTTNLIMAVAFGIIQIFLPIFLLLKIKVSNSSAKSKVLSTILGGLFPSIAIYGLSISHAFITQTKILDTAVIMVFMAGAFQIISLPVSLVLSKFIGNKTNFQAFFIGTTIPSILWFLLFFMSVASGI